MNPRPHNRVDFIYELKGEIGEIDVFELAPTLLSLGQLIKESNRILYPDGQELAVNVKPFREGSFIVDVVLFPASNLQHLLDLVRHTSADQIIHILKALGVVATATGGVIGVVKKLKGKPKQVKQLSPGEIRYDSDDTTISVGNDVHTLINNPIITQNIYNVYGKPLEKEGVAYVESYLKDEKEQTAVVVKKDDAPALKEISMFSSKPALLVAQLPELAEDTEKVAYLNPKRVAVDGEGSSWSFHRGSEVITATIKDEAFLGRVERGEIRPNHKDLMVVSLLEKQRVVGTEVKPPIYEITKVIQYREAPVQGSLLPPAEENPPAATEAQ